MQMQEPFVWGVGGAQSTKERAKMLRERAERLLAAIDGQPQGIDVSPVQHWLQGAARVAGAAAGAYGRYRDQQQAGVDASQADAIDAAGRARADKAFESLTSWMGNGQGADVANSQLASAGPRMGGAATANGALTPANSPAVAGDKSHAVRGDAQAIMARFMDTAKKGGLTNPYGLAALAATGKRESGFSPANANRTWDDPSEKGAPGKAGGILSWRAERHNNLMRFAAARGEKQPSVETQAAFFLREDPSLVAKLNAAKSPDEAANLMARAWMFAGYNRPGGEAAARAALTRKYASMFSGGQQPTPPQADENLPPVIQANARAGAIPFDQIKRPQIVPIGDAPAPAAPVPPVPLVPPVQAVNDTPAPPPVNMPTQAQLLAVVNDEYASDAQRFYAKQLLERQMALDPRLQDPLDREAKQMQIEQGRANLSKVPLEIQKLQQDVGLAQTREERDAAKFKLDQALQQQQLAKGDAELPVAGKTGDIQEYEYAKRNGFVGNFQQWVDQKARSGAAQSNVNIDQRAEGAFEKGVAEGQAKLFTGLADDARNAVADKATIAELRQNLSQTPGGFVGGLQSWASGLGIKLGENAGAVETASALINKLVPAQRAPGSGQMSDRDVELFKSSLPRLSNTPEGNAIILDTMEAMADFRMAQGDIASSVMTGEITRAEATKRLRALPDPMKAFRERGKAASPAQAGQAPVAAPSDKREEPLDMLLEKYK